MTVSIVIPTLNESRNITTCLQSLLAQSKKPEQVIIVDDSDDEIIAIADDLQQQFFKQKIDLRLLSGSRSGVAAARQLGFTQSNTEIIASLDADCVAAPNWLENLCEPIESGLTQATTGKIIMSDAPRLMRTLTEWGWYGWYYNIIHKVFGFQLFSGAYPDVGIRHISE
jgi:glycosyltransferase involved in cell wall biosynthesis